MAAPIGNALGNPVSRERAAHTEQNPGNPKLPGKPNDEVVAPGPQSGDRISLSDTGRRMSIGEESTPLNSPEEAADLVARLRERMQLNPGLATAAQGADAHSRLATLVDQFGLNG